jgi:hypothetical protein
MAEVLGLGLLVGAGYLFNKNGITRDEFKSHNTTVPDNKKPSYNVYNSEQSVAISKAEQQRATDVWNQPNIEFPGPPEHPLRLNKTDGNTQKRLPVEFKNQPNGAQDQSDNFCGYSLTGEYINPNTFKHNNMTPYFGGSIKQNVDEYATKSILENFTGDWSTYKKKEEVKHFFEPEKNVSNVHGTNQLDSLNTNDKDRYYMSNLRNNERPFEKIHVGPGLNQGYTAEPSGGFQQEDARYYALPKRTNELRTKNDPKLTYEGRVLPGEGIGKRTLIGQVVKKQPDGFYENTPDRWNTTTGAVQKDRYRSTIRINNNSRNQTGDKAQLGPAISVKKKRTARGRVHKPLKTQLKNGGVRNAEAYGKWSSNDPNAPNDYGKKTTKLKHTGRQTRTHNTNQSGYVGSVESKKLYLPFDPKKVKKTRKENMIGNPNTMGYMKPSEHTESYTYDPELWTARTTVKETTLHDNNNGYMGVSEHGKTPVHDPSDVARTTVKETTLHDNNNGYMGAAQHGKQYVYDPNDISRTTVREQTEDNDWIGQICSDMKKGITYNPKNKPKTTNKEIFRTKDYIGGAIPQSAGNGYKITDINIDPTMRQTTTRERYEHPAKRDNNGYQIESKQMVAPVTQRQDYSDVEYVGNAGNGETVAPMSYEDIYNLTIKSVREDVAVGREPSQEGPKSSLGGNSIHMDTHKNVDQSNNTILERGVTAGAITNPSPSSQMLGDLTNSNTIPIENRHDDLNDVLVNQLQKNPYVHNINDKMFY